MLETKIIIGLYKYNVKYELCKLKITISNLIKSSKFDYNFFY